MSTKMWKASFYEKADGWYLKVSGGHLQPKKKKTTTEKAEKEQVFREGPFPHFDAAQRKATDLMSRYTVPRDNV